MKNWKDRVCLFLASAGGLGLMPIAPGSFGALLGVGMFAAVELWVPIYPFVPFKIALNMPWWLPPPTWQVLALVICFVVVCVAHFLLTPWAQRYWKTSDPSHFVLDEVAGYLVTLILLSPLLYTLDYDWSQVDPSGMHPKTGYYRSLPISLTWTLAIAGFFLFRIFDIIKLPGARYIDRNWHGAWGVLLDDIVSGIYAAGAVWFAARFWSALFAGGGNGF